MPAPKFVRTALYYLTAFSQGVCLILFPAAGFIFKSGGPGAITDQQYGFLFLPMISLAIVSSLTFEKIMVWVPKPRIFYAGFFFNFLCLLCLLTTSLTKGNSLGTFALIFSSNLCLGIAFGLLVPVLNVFIVEDYPKKRDAFLAGLHGCIGIGCATSPLLVNYFYQKGNWLLSVVACLAVCLGTATLAFAARVVSEKPVAGFNIQAERTASREPMSFAAFLFIVTICFYGMIESIVGNWTSGYLQKEKGFSINTAAFAISTFWASITAGRIIATFLTLKLDARWLYRFSPLLILISLFAIIRMQDESRILLCYIGVGLGCSYFYPFNVSLSTQYHDRWRDSLSSLSITGLMAGVGVGSAVVGFLREKGIIQNLEQAFFMAICSASTLIVLSFFLTLRKPVVLEK